MSANLGTLWVVATAATAERWAAEFRRAGYDPHALVWGRPQTCATPAYFHAVVARERPDLVMLTSTEALTFLGEARSENLAAACVGPATAAAAAARGFQVVVHGEDGSRQLAQEILGRETAPRRVLWLRGREARSEGAASLRAAGVTVFELVTYAIEPEPAFAPALRAAPEPSSIAVGSPRGVDALVTALGSVGRVLPRHLPLLVSGTTTSRRLEEWGCADPDKSAWSIGAGPGIARYHRLTWNGRDPRPPRDA
jgi:uroporphyrinogen-III synthase